MKRTIRPVALLLAALLLAAVCCSCEIKKGSEKKEKPYVICTIFPQYDFVRNIVGDTMEVELLIPPGSETHTFSYGNISFAQLKKMADCDLLVYTGGESDEKLIADLKAVLTRGTKFVALVDLVSKLLDETETEGMTIGEDGEEEHDDHDEDEYDEHVWTSPKNAVEIVNGLLPQLIALSGENEAQYRANAASYEQKLKDLDAKFAEVVSKAKFKTAVFADRFPFCYLFHDYGLTADAAFKGCSASIDPSPAQINHLYQKAKDLHLPAILYMEGSDPKFAENLAKQIGGKPLLLHSCHIVTEKEMQTTDYIGIQLRNVEVLRYALGASDEYNG